LAADYAGIVRRNNAIEWQAGTPDKGKIALPRLQCTTIN
jgi:hypothetical protein